MTTLHLVELGVLGPLEVRQAGLPVTVPGAKPRAILTMLGLHDGSVVSADSLVELLWGDDPPRTAAKALQTHISLIRRTLGDGFVLTQGAGWVLAETEVDAARYKAAARLGRDAAAAGDDSRAVMCFDEALALWRGIPELPDGRRGTPEKTRWIEAHAALVEDRADALLATGRAAEIVGELEAAVADAPLRERRWAQLMLALYRAGRQGDALGAYQRARALLADELGVDPGPNLRRLEALIVAQDAALEVPAIQRVSSVTRAVTFLLTDIEGSTAAWEADAGAMAVALARHDELVEQVVTSRGGRLIKTRGEGDATFSVFDRPSAAAAAAIELQDAIAHEPWALSEPMRVRVALHTGEAELRDGDYFGRAVNRAARLRSLAVGGQILCSGATAELVIDSLPDHVALADLGRRELRNLARPEHVFELRLGTAEDHPEPVSPEVPMERPALPAVLAGPGPFVGRGDELQRLFSVWQTALAGGTNAVLIAGEPGVGKTRLAGEWSRQAYDQGALVIYGRCDEDLGAPYQPFAEALRALLPCLGAGGLRGLRGVEALLALVPGLTDILPDLAAPTRADPDTERYALFDAVVAVLGVASASAPVVLILDDLHWAAKPTLLLLRHLLRFGEQARVQIIGTYRSTDLDRSHPLAAMLADLHRDGSGNRIQLSGLDEDDVTAYVAEAGYHDEELARALASVTGGNPFFLIEALRHVDESGGRWDPSTLPQGVREAVSRRLTRLLPETNKALAAAAVVGSRFALELVESVVGDDLVDAFDEACKAGIVIEEPGGRYRFNHALVRQSLLAELPSVRRMRLHQRIAATLESQPGAEDELLAELAHHYFECAWAGNAVKAVEYCRRAADQAMARLAYEGAADLYDHALHALEEIDDELPDRDDQAAELLVARCEALLAAGDVASAAGAVSELQGTTVDSARLAAWATCFDGQLSMLIHPERLDEAEAALSAAAAKLAELDDAAGEAKAHTVRAGCLARLGRIGDCEVALDDALTAARRAREHRRVNAVLANAPLAALWGPNPVPRAGGRCLDVVRLLRITTDSPAVEATSTRCQAVLEAFRGRAAAARRMIDSARRTVTELGLRHALLEVEQFAGIVELIVDEPAAAEAHLLKAYNGFRRMGLDADTAETAALLGRTCLALDRDADAAELCAESERLAGHALKPSIAWRTLRAQLLSRSGNHGEARRVAEAAVSLAERTDALVDHGDACATLATVVGAAGDVAGARAAAERAVGLYERKGAAALADKARDLLGKRVQPVAEPPPEAPSVELDNAAARVGERVMAAIHRRAWDEVEHLFAPDASIESRRKIVGLTLSSDAVLRAMRRELEMGTVRIDHVMVAARGERLALSRLITGSPDVSPGAPRDELLQLYAINDEGQVAWQVWFDVEDLDAALGELDAAYARLENGNPPAHRLENAATRVDDQAFALFAESRWDELSALYADNMRHEDRRQGLRRSGTGRAAQMSNVRAIAATGDVKITITPLALRGDRLSLSHMRFELRDPQPDAFKVDILQITEVDDGGVMVAQTLFDIDDFDAAIAELDASYGAGEAAAYSRTWSVIAGALVAHNRREIAAATPDVVTIDHRRVAAFAPGEGIDYIRAGWDLDQTLDIYIEIVHRMSELGAVFTWAGNGGSQEGFAAEWRGTDLMTVDGEMLSRVEVFDEADIDAAIARFDQLSRPAPRLENTAARALERMQACFTTRDWDALADTLVDEFHNEDRRRVVNGGVLRGRGAAVETMRGAAELGVTHATSTVIATRGERLVLAHARFAQGDDNPETFQADALQLAEIDADERLTASILFDAEDFGAAFEELDARYLAGEAAPYANTWSAIAEFYAALNRHEFPAAPDWVGVDHRQATTVAHGDLAASIYATWEIAPNISRSIEAVHRLDNLGAVVTHTAYGTSQEGFDAEWRLVALVTVTGDLIGRAELFDEEDVDRAIAKFDRLSRPTLRPEGVAAQAFERLRTCFAARDWDAMAETLAVDIAKNDRRRVVGEGLRQGRAAMIAEISALAELGVIDLPSDVIASRGRHLALINVRSVGRDQRPDAFRAHVLNIVETVAAGQIAALVTFDVDDFDAAIAELDARYLAGEAAAYSRAWSVISDTFAAHNRREIVPTTPDVASVDHRRVAAFAPGEGLEYIRAGWDLHQKIDVYIETVHRLNDHGAVFSWAGTGTSREGFAAEWRGVNLLIVNGELLSRAEVFDEDDLDAAIARFEQLGRPAPRLENAAARVFEHVWSHYAARDWHAMAESVAEDFSGVDHRRVVSAETQESRADVVRDLRAAAEVGFAISMVSAVAIRGERLVLARVRASGHDPGAIQNDALNVVEIDDDERIANVVTFDLDDYDAAIAELDARYMAGEAAAYSRAWSVISGAYAAMNRHEFFAMTPDFVDIDHRHVTTIAAGDTIANLRASWELAPDLSIHIEAVHKLNHVGAVITYAAYGTSQEGFQGEWRAINILTVEGDLTSRAELFDEEDLDAAIVRFDQLSRPAPRLENAASQAYERVQACFAARDWDAMANAMAQNMVDDDRRHMVNAGVRRGRDIEIANGRAVVEIGGERITSTVIATRGRHLALCRSAILGQGQQSGPFCIEFLSVIESDADERLAAHAAFDLDDFGTALAKLDARYLTGEAAAHSRTWSVITQAYAALNRRELPSTTRDWVNIDHRRGTSFAFGEMPALLDAAWNLPTHLSHTITAVHRLNDRGAVLTSASHETSQEGFDAEWRVITVVTVAGDMLNRCEIFDEEDLDAAIARFDQLSRPAPRLENAASRVDEHFQTCFAARDWDAMGDLLADDICADDRRRVVNAGVRHGRAAKIADMRATADLGTAKGTSTVIAIRGQRLALLRIRLSGRDQRPDAFHTEMLGLAEVNADNRMTARVLFDPDDFDAAIAELDARYLAGEAAAHARTWSFVTSAYAAFNRRKIPAKTPNAVYTDHRRLVGIEDGGLGASLRALWEQLAPQARIYIESVHRLTDLGVVVTHTAHATSREGFDAEWREINLLTAERDLVNHCELFDEAEIDAALARFEELSSETRRLENAASRVGERFLTHFGAGDWAAMTDLLADNFSNDDRRRMVGIGVRHGRDVQIADMRTIADLFSTTVTPTTIATRGTLLALMRLRFSARDHGSEAFLLEAVGVLEINADERIVAVVFFDVDDLDTALEELDARYLAGEAAAHAHTWSAVKEVYGAINRHEYPAMRQDSICIDHRPLVPIETVDLATWTRKVWDLTPNLSNYVETVNRLTTFGAVVTHAARGTSQEGFDAEWRLIDVLMFDGDLIRRLELFEEADLDAALGRFAELHPPAPRLENAASQVAERFPMQMMAGDWAAMTELLAIDVLVDDRRRGVNAGIRHGREAAIQDMRAAVQVGFTNTASRAIATRGERLVIMLVHASGRAEKSEAFQLDVLHVVEINREGRTTAVVVFDSTDTNAAFEELDKRYLAGEAASRAQTWSVVSGAYAAMNRHELFPTTSDWVNRDHRRPGIIEDGGLNASLRSLWELIPDLTFRIEAVHRLTDRGAVCSHVAHGVSRDGFDAEWRGIEVITTDRHLINRCEIFDSADLDAALTHFEQLHPSTRPLENAASQVAERYWRHFAAREWAAMEQMVTDEFVNDDRRRVVGAGPRHGSDAAIADMRVIANIWGENVTSTVIATRGTRLALMRIGFSSHEQGPQAFTSEIIAIAEIDANERLVAAVSFDADDLDGALDELDARYLAGEAAPYARAWQLGMDTIAELNRHERGPMIRRLVYADHRRVPFESGEEFGRGVEELWALVPDTRYRVKTAHALAAHGNVVTLVIEGADAHGNELQWGRIIVFACDEPRVEVYEEEDLDAALARFEELRPQPRRPKSAVAERFLAHFAARDWDVMAQDFAVDYYHDDRRRVVNAGVRYGRDAAIEELRVAADIGLLTNLTLDIIATRGKRLMLTRYRVSGRDSDVIQLDALQVTELDADERIVANVSFDPDEIDAAFEELDARYLAGEAASHAETWSAVAKVPAQFNRHELFAMTPDPAYIDHRRLVSVAGVDLAASVRAVWDITSDASVYIEAVHRLSERGAVFTEVLKMTSRAGFDAEVWMIMVFTVEAGLIGRVEVFDEQDLEAALTRFDELHPPDRRPGNAASRLTETFFAHAESHAWDAMAEIVAEDSFFADRRRVVNFGVWRGRDAVATNMRVLDEVEAGITLTVIATRGERLALTRVYSLNRDLRHGEFDVELLSIVEADAENRIVTLITFDPNDIDTAIAELDSRYLAGEAAAHARTWSVLMRAFVALNRREIPAIAPDWVRIDHRSLAPFEAGDWATFLHATWDVTPNLTSYIEVVHKLSDAGAVVTHVSHGTSQDGVDAEWRIVDIFTVDGELVSGAELFDEADLDAALARFDDLDRFRPNDNAATRIWSGLADAFNRRDLDGFFALTSPALRYEDRRKGLRDEFEGPARRKNMQAMFEAAPSGSRLTVETIAIRGQRLSLTRAHYADPDDPDAPTVEMLQITEVDQDGLLRACVSFDPDDIDAALTELTARWVASGEAADPNDYRERQPGSPFAPFGPKR